jgi:hypothetical protein
LIAFAGLFACLKPAPTVEPEGNGGAEVPAGSVDPGPDPAADGGQASADGGQAPAGDDGGTPSAVACLSDADCNGDVCEGQGCGDAQPGTCVSKARMCTRDSRPYCGCDGQTFRASGSCPGRRYAAKGECSAAPVSDAKAP